MEALGVIPARGGSRRVPRKNLRDLGGKPLVQWTVEAAQRSRLTRVVVATEDPEIAALAIRLGVEVVPQPLETALDGTISAPVVLAALDFMRDAHGYEPEAVCLLHPTSPFRTHSDIDDAFDLFQANGRRGSVISFTRDELNGAIYLTSTENFRWRETFFHGPIHPLTLNAYHGMDIDTWDDLEEARQLVS